MFHRHPLTRALLISLCLVAPQVALATGMVPETSVVLLDEDKGGGTINVKNTNAGPELLYVTIKDLPEDKKPQIIVTQPISRVEAGATQQVRFVIADKTPLTTQHLKRVTFEGVPVTPPNGKNQVTMTVRQDLPLIVSPKDLPDNTEPWKLLKWSNRGQSLVVTNPGPYVVRLSQQLQLQPSGQSAMLSKTYILPGETLTAEMKSPLTLASNTQVKLFPATRYGYQEQDYTAPLVSGTGTDTPTKP